MGDYRKRGGAIVHRLANIAGDVRLGDGTRVDAFVTITGRVNVGRNVHISTGACIFGGEGVEIGDYSAVSVQAKILTATEDLSGESFVNPTVDHDRAPIRAPIRIGRHCVVGAGSVLLPGADMPDGACLGALSLLKAPLAPWSINAGAPARYLKHRSRGVLEKEWP